MSRGLTVEQLAAVAAGTVRPAKLVYMDFLSGAVRVWSGVGNFVYDGNTYTGVGTFGGISETEETDNPVANGITLTLSGVPSELVATAMDRREYRGRKVRVWDVFFAVNAEDASGGGYTVGELIGTPIPTFAGRMDVMTPTDTGDTSTIALACENRLIDLERPRERRRTHQDQLERAGDSSFRYVAGLQDKEFPWGQKTNRGATGGGFGFKGVQYAD
jgi:hypothetical protein